MQENCLPVSDEELMKISEMQLAKRGVGNREPQCTPSLGPIRSSSIHGEKDAPILRPSIVQEPAREPPETEEQPETEQRPEPDFQQDIDMDILVREIAEERPDNLDQERNLAVRRRVSIPFLFQYQNYIIRM